MDDRRISFWYEKISKDSGNTENRKKSAMEKINAKDKILDKVFFLFVNLNRKTKDKFIKFVPKIYIRYRNRAI